MRYRLALTVLGMAMAVRVGQAGSGLVALQSADPACPDDSGKIYADCGNGTVTDNRTGLVWLANADCMGQLDWYQAMEFVAGLSDTPGTLSEDCGLGDHSKPGEWRLPSKAEWEAMIADAIGHPGDPDCRVTPPTITNDSGLGCWASGPSSFVFVRPEVYHSVTPNTSAWYEAVVALLDGGEVLFGDKAALYHSWPVRAGQ